MDKNRRMVEGSSPTIQSVQNTKYRIRLKCCTIQLYSESQQFFQEWNVGGRTVRLVGRPILSHNTLTYSESPFILDVTIVYTIQTRSSWLNCALRDDEAVYWVCIGHPEAVAVRN